MKARKRAAVYKLNAMRLLFIAENNSKTHKYYYNTFLQYFKCALRDGCKIPADMLVFYHKAANMHRCSKKGAKQMGAIYITGDCHSSWSRFSTRNFPQQKEMTREDYVIVCGDFGIWNDSTQERKMLDWLAEKNFTLLFVDGNHENFDRLYGGEFEEVEFHGGRAHRIRENIYHLMRGYVFSLCGKKVFAFGGASSHDIADGIVDPAAYADNHSLKKVIRMLSARNKQYRIKGVSWWPEEMPRCGEPTAKRCWRPFIGKAV